MKLHKCKQTFLTLSTPDNIKIAFCHVFSPFLPLPHTPQILVLVRDLVEKYKSSLLNTLSPRCNTVTLVRGLQENDRANQRAQEDLWQCLRELGRPGVAQLHPVPELLRTRSSFPHCRCLQRLMCPRGPLDRTPCGVVAGIHVIVATLTLLLMGAIKKTNNFFL